MSDILDQWHYFVSPVYSIKKPEFLEDALGASKDSVKNFLSDKNNKVNETYPVIQTDMSSNEKIEPLLNYVINTAWNLIDSQGYDMQNLSTYFTEVWCQSHRKFSSMDYHMHGDCHMTAFYFLECPKECPKFIIHDPRPGKMMIPLKEKNYNDVTLASSGITFDPEPGTLMFTNSWLPHSFTRNASKSPFNFIHMNIGVRPYIPVPEFKPTAEIV